MPFQATFGGEGERVKLSEFGERSSGKVMKRMEIYAIDSDGCEE